MNTIRRRFARLTENMVAFAIGAVIVCLANGMSPAEMVDLALANMDQAPEKLPEILTSIFRTAFAS